MVMFADLLRAAFFRTVAIAVFIAIAWLADASAQQSHERAGCDASGTGTVSLDAQISACTAVIQSGKETRWDRGVALYKRGSAYYFKGDSGRAIADYNEAARLGLYTADVLNNRGIAHHGKGDVERALADLNEAIRLDSQHAGAFSNRGNVYYEKGDHSRALADYNEAIRLDPTNADALNNRCWLRAAVEQLPAALDDCDASLRLRPNDAEFLDSRGFTYLKLRQVDNAIGDYDAVLGQNPRKAHSLYGRGLARLEKGDRQGGDADIAAAKAVNANIAQEFTRRGVPPAGMRATKQALASAAPPTAPAAAAPAPTVAAAPAPAAAAAPVTVKELFEKYDLFGTFAADCSMPVSEQNQYIVHRANSDYVQRDSMVGPSTRADASLIESVSEPAPNELDLTMTNERGRTNEVIRLGDRQWRSMEAARDNGEKLISGGRAMQGARLVSPWLKKCG
jgi:tetratricopeptide (TPR) repeat protein